MALSNIHTFKALTTPGGRVRFARNGEASTSGTLRNWRSAAMLDLREDAEARGRPI